MNKLEKVLDSKENVAKFLGYVYSKQASTNGKENGRCAENMGLRI